MFRRLRRSTKQSQTSKCEALNLTGRRRTSFFDLPAELRNHIYALAVQHIQQLRIVPRTSPIPVPIKRKHNRQNDRIPALFVTSRQCRAEYLPILLATAPIEIRILDFDFRSLGRIIGSLYSSELKKPSAPTLASLSDCTFPIAHRLPFPLLLLLPLPRHHQFQTHFWDSAYTHGSNLARREWIGFRGDMLSP